MFNLSTLTALAVDPAVTLSVIAILTVLLVLSILDGRRRLNAFAVKSAKMSARLTASLVAAVIESAQKEMKRREAKTIGWTYDQLKRIGFDKLALGTVTFEDVMRSGFSSDDLKEALRPRHADNEALKTGGAFTDDNAGGFDDAMRPTRRFVAEGETDVEDAAGPGPKRDRPYRFTGDARSPRAG